LQEAREQYVEHFSSNIGPAMLPFLTAYDPLGGSPASIDPLGALQSYGSLADLLLPGVTTVTTRSRYLSMLCAALLNAEEHLHMLPGASGLYQRRKAIEPFERLWALACVAARQSGHEGASDGLRGITYAEKGYRHFMQAGDTVHCNFPLLKYQSRTGAVGTYWAALVAGQLIDGGSGSLLADGRELAEDFPDLPLETRDRSTIANQESAHRVSLAGKALLKWGEHCHLRAASREERQKLSEALTADDRRESVSRALADMYDAIPDIWNTQHLKRLKSRLSNITSGVALGLPTVVDAIIVTEQFHDAALVVFDTLLWWATMRPGKTMSILLGDSDFRKSLDRCWGTAVIVREFHEKGERPDVRDAITGLFQFASAISRCGSDHEVVDELLNRHHAVQSGKIDGGMPKRDWIAWDRSTLLRPCPRFQRKERPRLSDGSSLTHPYRLEEFIYMLRENRALPASEGI
jgi:hypothetical protein